ncbi:BtpA/SgcQ family protein [Natronobiforma cellulositropha]|uniref:BtpA/SgcQ family protein n=1 Tax=Natronobiforma cellulositropha TaxID=1679076 RepID=UPI0021D61310|nr:BtpA/SgcQ family protein [Natronobiforma cellulositropha]
MSDDSPGLLARFDTDHPLVGMVHLPPLPGAPGFDGDRAAISERALADAETLAAGGVDAVLVENFGDAPFYPDAVPPHVVADLTALAAAVTDAVDCPVGINVLRNDAAAALSVASAVGGSFVRVNVHTASAATDQGLVHGRAHETLRLRETLAADVSILADVHVKHATPIGGRSLETAVRETVARGLADGVVVSGPGTGEETALTDLRRVVETVAALERPVPVFVGSGVTPDRLGAVFDAGADGVIVGSALERGGVAGNPVVSERVESLVRARRAWLD